MSYCSNCGYLWTSLIQCHCVGCHQHFKSETSFKKHKRGGQCLAIEEMLGKKMFYDAENRYWITGKMPDIRREG